MTTIKAIETKYKGYRFRSRLEARWAVYFDALRLEWVYEPEGYTLADGTNYLPDFWIPSWNSFVEVKAGSTRIFKITKDVYLAGKMDSDWRTDIIVDCKPFKCTNPFLIKHDDFTDVDSGRVVTELSLAAIDRSDFVFAYISTLDCFGTLAEIGYAVAKKIPTYIAVNNNCIPFESSGGHGFYSPLGEDVWTVGHNCKDQSQNNYDSQYTLEHKGEYGECWFAATIATGRRKVKSAGEAARWFDCFLPNPCEKDEEKSMRLAQQSGKNVIMLRDIPQYDTQAKVFMGRTGAVHWKSIESYFAFQAARSARFEFDR